jgi:hypothetical protein
LAKEHRPRNGGCPEVRAKTQSEEEEMLVVEENALKLLHAMRDQPLREDLERVHEELEAERSKGFWRRVIGG